MTELSSTNQSERKGDSHDSAKMVNNVLVSTFRKLTDIWHPHVYAHPPRSLTPFSIADILKENNEDHKTINHNNSRNGLLLHNTAYDLHAMSINFNSSGGSSTGGSPRVSTPVTEAGEEPNLNNNLGLPAVSVPNSSVSMEQPLNLTTKKKPGEPERSRSKGKEIL